MEDNVSSRCTSHRRLSSIPAAAAVLAALFAINGAVPAPAAEKSRKSESKREKPAKEKSASNKSVRTQQRTADAFAEKTDKSKKPQDEQPADTVDSLQDQLADVAERIRRENERHESVLADLREAASDKQAAKARKAIEKEDATHRRNRAALDDERAALLARLDTLNGKSPSKAPADRSTGSVARTR
jgi:small-conductance mechanosensitive channel